MALIYLRHDVHGVKIATLEMEAEADVENGWERFDPNDDSGRSDQGGVEAPGRSGRRRNAFSGDISRRLERSEPDDRQLEH